MSRSIEKDEYYVFLEDGIMHVIFKKIDGVDLPIIEACVSDRLKLSSGKSYPVFVDPTLAKNMTRKARNYLGQKGDELAVAIAILTKIPVVKMVANLFLILHKPKGNYRLFTDSEEAKEWLKAFGS